MASPEAEWQALPSDDHENGGSSQELDLFSTINRQSHHKPRAGHPFRRHNRSRPNRGPRRIIGDKNDSESDAETSKKRDGRRNDTPCPVLRRPINDDYDEPESELESASAGEGDEPPPAAEDRHRHKRLKADVIHAERNWSMTALFPPPPYSEASPAPSTSVSDDPEAPL